MYSVDTPLPEPRRLEAASLLHHQLLGEEVPEGFVDVPPHPLLPDLRGQEGLLESVSTSSRDDDPRLPAMAASRCTRIPLSPPSLDSIGSGGVWVKCSRTSSGLYVEAGTRTVSPWSSDWVARLAPPSAYSRGRISWSSCPSHV